MIEAGCTDRITDLMANSGLDQNSLQDYRLLTSDVSELKFDPGDLQSLTWLTSVDVPRLQQVRGDFVLGAQEHLHTASQLSTMGVAGGAASMIHLQSNVQHSPLGINTMPVFSPGFPCPASVFQSSAQQVLTFSHQQCSPGGPYTTYTQQNVFTQQQIPPHSQESEPKTFPKPIYSYSCLIAMALKNSKSGSLPVSEIYSFMKEHFPYFKTAPDGWKNSVRHNLSLNKCFEKVENRPGGSSRKGCLWALNPARVERMEEEMHKWRRKDLASIRRSMANPDELDKLITDRPESCRRKLPPPPLALQCLPLHLQLHSQAALAPASPAAAQTPPPHPAQVYSAHGDAHSEVDALDPSIMDFSFQGNLWDEMKDDSFNLEALGSFSASPLRLSDCDLDVSVAAATPGPGDAPFSGVYASYGAAEAFAPPYMGGGAKPIVLH